MVRATPTLPHFVGDLQPGSVQNGQGVISIDTALYLADYLAHSGVQRIYAVPDPEVVALLNAFRLRGVESIATREPTSGAMLAAAESAVHHGIGVIIAGAGASAAAIAPVAAQAQIERRSLIAITVEPNGQQTRTSSRRLLDLRAIFASVSKGSYRLTADNARELVPLAGRLATTPPRGAVHLRVHSDELTTTAVAARGQAHPPATPSTNAHAALVQQAGELLATAERPVLLVGLEVVEARSDAAARLLAEQWNAPIVVTPMAKGTVPETHPAFAGVYGAWGDAPVAELIAQSDLVVGFGVSSADFGRRWQSTVPTVHLTHSSGDDPGFPATVTLFGPLNALANELPRRPASTADSGEARAAAVRRAIHELIATAQSGPQLNPQTTIGVLRRLTAPDVPLAVETDPAGLLAAQAWTTTAPATFLISNGLGHPGSGLALASVAAATRQASPVLWLGTDAALMARPGLLAHLRGLPGPLPLIVIHQGANIDLLRIQEAAGVPRVASEYAPVNLEALAGTYGLGYARVHTVEDLEPAVASALTVPGAAIIDVMVEREHWWRVS